MTHLEEITGDALREALWNVEDATAAIRLAAAIIYKQDVNQSEIGEWLGVTQRTIYNWLTRLESEPRELSETACDDNRPGRPPRLSDQQQDQLEETLQNPPSEAGYDAPVWTPALVRQHIKETFDVEYSLSSCRRWLRRCGMSYKKPRRENTKADPEEREEFREEAADKQEEDATIVCIDQLRASVRQEPKAGWFPKGSTPTVELAGDRDWTMALGAITEAGDRFLCQTEESLTGEHSKRFIAALCEEIEDDLVVMLDNAPYFVANVVTDLVEARDDLELLYFPTYSPDMNPMEICWRQVRKRIGNRLFDSLSELHRAITNAFDEISIPDVGNYF